MKTLPLTSKSAPAESASVMLPLIVIPSLAFRVTAPISFALPIAPVKAIVSVVEALSPSVTLAVMVTVSEESPLIPATLIAPPSLVIVKLSPSSKSIVPVAKVIAFPVVAALPPKLATVTAPPVKSITSPVPVAVIVTVSDPAAGLPNL